MFFKKFFRSIAIDLKQSKPFIIIFIHTWGGLAEWLKRTTVNRVGNCRWFESNNFHMFDMLIKFLKTYTIWGQYIQEKHYKNFYYIIIIFIIIFIYLNLFLFI